MKTINLTPSWESILPLMLVCIENKELRQSSRVELHEEFRRMAEAADKYNEMQRCNSAAVELVSR
jgi:hypothetical protein